MKKPKSIPKRTRMKIPKREYQPSRAELREKVDMPGLSREQARKAFFRPFTFDPD